jgi:hypothetical protein
MNTKEQYLKNGFAILKNVFSKEEIEQFRENALKQMTFDEQNGQVTSYTKSQAKHGIGDILSKKYLDNIVLDSRVIKVVKEVLGEEVIYFGDGSYQIGVGLRGYHRDNVDREFKGGPDWDFDYNIIRFGLYLQDHKKYSGGLKVKVGTHENPTGKSTLLDIEEGDLIFWNLKLVHSGNAIRLKGIPNLPVDYLERFIPEFIKKDEQKERIAMFFTFGVKGQAFDRYINEYVKKTPKLLEGLRQSKYSDKTIQLAESSGVELFDVINHKN